MLAFLLAGVSFALLWATSFHPEYGYFIDELYYIACSKHLAFGYVDHAPLVPWIARIATTLFGESVYGLRLFAAGAGALSVLLVGLLARRLGGGRTAQVLACLAATTSIVFLAMFNFFTVNCTGILLWTLSSWMLLELCRSR